MLKHGIEETINEQQLKFYADYVGNIFLDDKKLSEIIFNHIYPKPSQTIFSHYTDFGAAVNIISSGEFWIFNLIKNFKGDEFSHFYRTHGLDGYEQNTNTFGI